MGVLDEYARWRGRLTDTVETVLLTHVAPAVKEEMQTQVYDKVYGAYDPKLYVRRFDQGGLADLENMDAFVDGGDMTLHVQNLAQDDGTGRLIAPVVESGEGYTWRKSKIYQMQPYPRPFTKATEEAVVQDGTVERELARGLREHGYEMTEIG